MSPTELDPHLRLLDEARLSSAAADRTRQRLLTEADEQDATFRGSLEALAEAGVELVVHTSIGRRLRGTVHALSADHLTLVGDHGRCWVRLDAITVVRVGAGTGLHASGGERSRRPTVDLAAALSDLVEDRATVEVLFDGSTGIRGAVAAAGRDLLTVRDGNGERALVHLDRAVVVISHA